MCPPPAARSLSAFRRAFSGKKLRVRGQRESENPNRARRATVSARHHRRRHGRAIDSINRNLSTAAAMVNVFALPT
jgi:hypothetical protein